MKYKIGLLVILFPVLAHAQIAPDLDTSLVNKAITELRSSWTVGIDSNNNPVDIRIYNQYKNLFDAGSKAVPTVDDDFNYIYTPQKSKGTYTINPIPKDFDIYAHDMALQLSKLVIDTGNILHKDLHNPDSIIIIIQRNIYAEKTRQYVLQDTAALAKNIISLRKIEFEKINKKNKDSADYKMMLANLQDKIHNNADLSIYKFSYSDTMFITMIKTNDAVKIKSIKIVIAVVTCINDTDNDAIPDNEDAQPNKAGDFTANGSPDYDLDAVADTSDKCRTTYGSIKNYGCPVSYFVSGTIFEGSLGMQLNSAKINLPELNKLGYKDESGNDAMRVLESKKGVLKSPGMIPGIYAGAAFIKYFGKKRKRTGLSIGIFYSGFTGNYELTEPAIYTFKSSDGIDFYRRQVTIKKLDEQISYNIINVPILFNFRTRIPGSKWITNFKLGPSLMLFNNVTNYDATVDIGGIYQVDPIENKITYDPYFDANSSYNIYLTSQGINNQNTDPGAANIFSQLAVKNYDFSEDRNYRNKQRLKRTTVAFNIALDGQYRIIKDGVNANELLMKVGLAATYAPLFERKEKYKPLDKTTDEFQSIYKSNAKSGYSAFGLSIGVLYNF